MRCRRCCARRNHNTRGRRRSNQDQSPAACDRPPTTILPAVPGLRVLPVVRKRETGAVEVKRFLLRVRPGQPGVSTGAAGVTYLENGAEHTRCRTGSPGDVRLEQGGVTSFSSGAHDVVALWRRARDGTSGFVHGQRFWLRFCGAATLSERISPRLTHPDGENEPRGLVPRLGCIPLAEELLRCLNRFPVEFFDGDSPALLPAV